MQITGHGHKLYMEICLMTLQKVKKKSYGTLRPNKKGMPGDIGLKMPKLKQGDIGAKTRDDLTVIWENKRELYMLTNMHSPPAEGILCSGHENTVIPSIPEDYSGNMGFMGKVPL